MTKKNYLAIALTATALTAPLAAFAAPVTYDFAGTGTFCTYNGAGTVGTCQEGKAFTGTVAFDVLADGPGGADGATDGKTWADDLSGWVDSDFTIQWDGNSFNPEVVPNLVWNWHDTQVLNEFSGVIDGLINSEQYEGGANGVWQKSSAGLIRETYDKTWINDLIFNPLLGLAPGGASTINRLYFENWTSVYDFEAQVSNKTGYSGEINLASMTLRPTAAVPEPGTLTLLGAGLAAMGFVRRRRRA